MKFLLLFICTLFTWVSYTQVPRWSVYEIALTSTAVRPNPYVETQLTATFVGPKGIKITVRGFWDGGQTFRIRFAPTEIGIWKYTTNSNDPSLHNQKGQLTCTSPLPQAHGFVRRDEAHPYHFVRDDGSRYLMLGTTYYGLISSALVNKSYRATIDSCLKYGINKIRFRINVKICQNEINPGPCSSVWGQDHDHLNLTHLRVVDELLTYMAERNMVADLMPFDSQEKFYGTDAQDLRYLRYVLARFAAYPNVIWCLTNEFQRVPNKPRAFWNTVGNIVRAEDPYIANGMLLRPLSIHPFGGESQGALFQWFDASWPSHIILQSGRFLPADTLNLITLRNRRHQMPIVNDEFGYFDDDIRQWKEGYSQMVHRQALWSIYMAGGHATIGDKATYPDGRPYQSTVWHSRNEYYDLLHLSTLFSQKGLEYWKMEPANDLVTGRRAYALAYKDAAGIVYAAVGGEVTLHLSVGNYTAWLYNPRTGQEKSLSPLIGNKPQTVTFPSNEDWVMYYKKQ
ncbi:MAG: DUF5060 domain-containing protein [Runella sp.]